MPVIELTDDVRAVFEAPTSRTSPRAAGRRAAQRAGIPDGDEAWLVIDRLSHKYTGQPCPERSDRVVFLVAPEHAMGMTFR